jgi:hypothetical protein
MPAPAGRRFVACRPVTVAIVPRRQIAVAALRRPRSDLRRPRAAGLNSSLRYVREEFAHILDQVPDGYRDINEREALKVTVKPSVQQSRCPIWIIARDRRARLRLTAICAHHAARIDVKHTFHTAEVAAQCRKRAL